MCKRKVIKPIKRERNFFILQMNFMNSTKDDYQFLWHLDLNLLKSLYLPIKIRRN